MDFPLVDLNPTRRIHLRQSFSISNGRLLICQFPARGLKIYLAMEFAIPTWENRLTRFQG
jgi:hypothetical protein